MITAIIIENTGTLESLSQGRLLVSHRWLKTFGPILLLYVIVGIIYVLVEILGTPLTIATTLVSSILAAFKQPILPIVLILYYYSMITRASAR